MTVATDTLVNGLAPVDGGISIELPRAGGARPDGRRCRVLRGRLARQPRPPEPGRRRRRAPGRARSRLMTTSVPTSGTSSPPATSTGGRCWCRPPGWKAASRRGTRSSDGPGRPPTTWFRAAASPTPNTAGSA